MNGRQRRLMLKVNALQYAAGLVAGTDVWFNDGHYSAEEEEEFLQELRSIAQRLENHAQKLAERNGYEIEKFHYK